ncbi:sulfotransferase domain-containing protein [Thiococcus pfennigii]|jgi:hypothetical protein|nr:sulfotransferase domain-containing protein [Thiococcus pfennigii]MBK1699662.1 hypothetical protein [Thiococcus pfennigii]MBK1733241.1 hypothetical protein [Thiococcus pfennigii]
MQLISYPKCGRTWLVMMISKATELHYGITLDNPLRLRDYHGRNRQIPSIYVHHDGGPEFKRADELETDKGGYRQSRVVLLVRDPRDVLVSSFFQQTQRNVNYQGRLETYIRGPVGGLTTILAFYNIWARNAHVPKALLLITYEEMREAPAATLRKVLDFYALQEISDAEAEAAVEFCRFENMKEMEQQGRYATRSLSARRSADERTFKMRKGKVGGYREHLSPQDQIWVDGLIRETLDPTMFACYHTTAAEPRLSDGEVGP